MFIVYDILLSIFAVLYIPFYIMRGKFHKGLFMRLGFIRRDVLDALGGRGSVWLHAVSVGEIVASRQLVTALKSKYPQYDIIVSTVTRTGNELAKKIVGEGVHVIYLPFDISFIVKRVVKILNPKILVLIESELWPNLINVVSGAGSKIVIANGRISVNSFKGYMFVRFLLKDILGRIDAFSMQTDADKDRFIKMGVEAGKVYVSGNIKYDISESAGVNGAYMLSERRRFGLADGDKFIVAGSTHTGEEEYILDTFRALKAKSANLRLMIAPRHIERSDRVAKIAEELGFTPIRVSRLDKEKISSDTVFILDTIGHLSKLYSVADLVFIGGSLVEKGGHNPIEPAIYSKPIIFGAHMDNFKEISAQFIDNGAAICVKDKDALGAAMTDVIFNEGKALGLGRNALRLVELSKGATMKNLKVISDVLGK
ncbi:MAG: hypothetical protein AUJ75_00235 [Candidatus Omnitrophica bacterium CG1_02_49_10]|nr:MAG: hypothetical protein AUJ75_00235 [Candidatus Omnitrophica bacterium CG1_02_49_10]